MAEIDENEIVSQLQNNDFSNFSKLIDVYQSKVINTCYRFVLNEHDAEDIAQEVFLEIHRSISKFERLSSLSTWIYRISITKSLDFLRNKNSKKRFANILSIFHKNNEVLEIPANDSFNPEKNLLQKEKMEFLQTALDKLPENQRIAFVLNKTGELPNSEISRIMDISLKNVDILIHRAKKNLKEILVKLF